MDEAGQELQDFFYRVIPLSRGMGAVVTLLENGTIEVRAPLALNHNHLGTVFGGSLQVLGTLAGYAMAFQLMPPALRETAHAVIRRAKSEFLRPITSDPAAICLLPAPAATEAFLVALASEKKARVSLRAEIFQDKKIAFVFEAEFVVLPNSPAQRRD